MDRPEQKHGGVPSCGHISDHLSVLALHRVGVIEEVLALSSDSLLVQRTVVDSAGKLPALLKRK